LGRAAAFTFVWLCVECELNGLTIYLPYGYVLTYMLAATFATWLAICTSP